jgi:hypothetical protein
LGKRPLSWLAVANVVCRIARAGPFVRSGTAELAFALAHAKVPTQHRRLDVYFDQDRINKQLVLESYVAAGDGFRMNDVTSHKVL